MYLLGLVLVLMLSLQPAWADAGVPMIFLTFQGMLALLLPIIIVESLYVSRKLQVPFGQALKAFAAANALSTLIGIPLTWALLTAVEMVLTQGGRAYGLNSPIRRIIAVTIQAPWLIPYEEDLYWMVPAATLVLLIPYFLVSCWVEKVMAQPFLWATPRTAVREATIKANAISYGLLFIGASIWLVHSLAHPGH